MFVRDAIEFTYSVGLGPHDLNWDRRPGTIRTKLRMLSRKLPAAYLFEDRSLTAAASSQPPVPSSSSELIPTSKCYRRLELTRLQINPIGSNCNFDLFMCLCMASEIRLVYHIDTYQIIRP